MSHNGAIAESPRTPLHAPLKPADDIACGDLICHSFQQRSTLKLAIVQESALQRRFDARLGEFRAEIGIRQLVTAWLAEHGMISVQGSTEGQAFVAGRRLDIGAAERRAVE